MPTISNPRSNPASTAARMTAFKPGASPPPVEMATFLIVPDSRLILTSLIHLPDNSIICQIPADDLLPSTGKSEESCNLQRNWTGKFPL
jgi:hypothetical protein